MELKVWVDGIQRVVCGVTDSSTCQDVVYALAHATGQTGRFTLIEKWRNSERLLAPHEQPLKVLMKWGEYANDVHFVMRRSQTEASSKSHQQSGGQFAQNNKRQHDFLHNFSPTGPKQSSQKPKATAVNNKEIKKSLTFSCGHANSGSVSNESPAPNANASGSSGCNNNNSSSSVNNNNNSVATKSEPPPPPPPSDNIKSRDGRSRQDLPKGVVRGIPQRPRESESPNSLSTRTERPKHPPPYDEAVSRSSGRFAPSHLSLLSSNTTTLQGSTDEESPSSKRRHLAARTEPSRQSSNQSQTPSKVSNSSQNRDTDSSSPEHSFSRSSHAREKSPSKLLDKVSSPQKGTYIEDLQSTKSKKIILGQYDSEKHITGNEKPLGVTSKASLNHVEETSRDPQYQDLLRLVALQREKLENQQAELMQFDAEIVYWESRLQEQEEKLRLLQEEVSRLERMQHEQESELVELDRRPFNEEVELGRQEERTLRSELTLARSQLANCETELLQCHQRIRLLLEEIAEERRLQAVREEQEQKEIEEQENILQQQLENLQQQLKEKTSEAESQKEATTKVREELDELEGKISEKQKEVEKLMDEIRHANLYSLSLIPAEDGKFIAEGSFCNRPGSTRKIIGSPRQLENAVPTNKNPHGVWV